VEPTISSESTVGFLRLALAAEVDILDLMGEVEKERLDEFSLRLKDEQLAIVPMNKIINGDLMCIHSMRQSNCL